MTAGRSQGARRLVVVTAACVLLLLPPAAWLHNGRSDPLPERADVIYALAGTDGRARVGLDLLAQGRADVLVLSHVPGDEGLAARICEEPPAAVICAVPEPRSTRGEGRVFAQLADRHGWDSVIVVTDAWHTRRAGWILGACTDRPVVVHRSSLPAVRHLPRVVHEMGGILDLLIRPPCR